MKYFGIAFLLVFAFSICISPKGNGQTVMTVKGSIPAEKMGKTLIHEHILVDFIGADKVDPSRWEKQKVIEKVVPYIEDLTEIQFQAMIECTPAYLGRDPSLLYEISQITGLHLITNTGFYGAVDNKYLPSFAFTETAEQLAERWINEFENGIEGTGVKPGFIKISVNSGSLSLLHQKIVQAAGLTHLETGMTIASHTGPYLPAKEQVEVLEDMGIHPSAFIWVHAQGEKNGDKHLELAQKGVWISLDGVQEGNIQEYLLKLKNLKDGGMLHKVLISHDAGWYSPGEDEGGDFRSYDTIGKKFIPILLKNGFTEEDIELLLIKNPISAFSLSVRQ